MAPGGTLVLQGSQPAGDHVQLQRTRGLVSEILLGKPMAHHWRKYELSTGRGSAALWEAKVPLGEKQADQLKPGDGMGPWD